MVKFKDFSRPLIVFQVLFNANFIFKAFQDSSVYSSTFQACGNPVTMLNRDMSCFENSIYTDQLACTGYIIHTLPLVVHIIVYAVKINTEVFRKLSITVILLKSSTFSVFFEDYTSTCSFYILRMVCILACL